MFATHRTVKVMRFTGPILLTAEWTVGVLHEAILAKAGSTGTTVLEQRGLDGLGGFQASMYMCLILRASRYILQPVNETKKTKLAAMRSLRRTDHFFARIYHQRPQRLEYSEYQGIV